MLTTNMFTLIITKFHHFSKISIDEMSLQSINIKYKLCLAAIIKLHHPIKATLLLPGMSSSEIDELKTLLRSHNGDLEKLKKVMSKIMANVYVGKDMSSLFPDIVLQVRVKESSISRLIGMFTAQYGHLHSETALLCINQLTKEIMHDSEPLKRGHALQTLGSLNIPDLAEYIAPPIKQALQDSSPYVRRLAVDGCVKVFKMSRDVFEEQLLGLHLEEILEDFDEGVAAIAIIALVQTKPGYKMRQPLAMKLLKRLNDFSDWQVPLILSGIDTQTLTNGEAGVMEVLNLVDGFLDDCSPSVVLHTVTLLQPLITGLDSREMQEQFIDRVTKPLLFRVIHSSPEIAYWFCLEIPKIIDNTSVLFRHYRTFFPAYHDPAYLKAEKLRVLSTIINKNNVSKIVAELLECLNSPKHADICPELVECVTACVLTHGSEMSGLIVQLTGLLQSGSGAIISTLLPCLENIVVSLQDSAEVVLPQLQRCAEFDLTPSANIALLSMLGSYGHILPECVSMMYCYVEEYGNLECDVRTALLAACLKQSGLPGMATIAYKLLTLVAKDEDPLMRGRAHVYCNVILNNLKGVLDSKDAPHVIVSAKEAISFEDYPVDIGSVTAELPEEAEEPKSVAAEPVEVASVEVAVNLLEIDDLVPAPTVAPDLNTKQGNVGETLDDILGLNTPPTSNITDISTTQPSKNTSSVSINDDLSSLFGPPASSQKSSNNAAETQSVKNFLMTLSLTTVQPEVYEQNWGKSWKPEKFKVQLNKTNILVSTDMQALLLRHSISTMAITPSNQDPQQIFLYSSSAGMLVLMKILLSFVQNTLEIEVKSVNYMISQMMVKSVRHIFGVL